MGDARFLLAQLVAARAGPAHQGGEAEHIVGIPPSSRSPTVSPTAYAGAYSGAYPGASPSDRWRLEHAFEDAAEAFAQARPYLFWLS